MRIFHIVAGLKFGGVAEVAAVLALHQQKLGHEVHLVTVARTEDELVPAVSEAVDQGVRLLCFSPSFPEALFFSCRMRKDLGSVIQKADVVHVHSNWTFPVWWGCHTALKNGKRLVMTPHGCLSSERLMHSKWKKKAVGWIDRHFLKRADVIHATCEKEAEDIKVFMSSAGSKVLSRLRCWFEGSKSLDGAKGIQSTNELMLSRTNALPYVVVVPNGVDVEQFNPNLKQDFWKKRYPEIGERKVVLALGRLHPLKGLDLLVAAWGGLLRPHSRLRRGYGAHGGRNDEGKRGKGKRDFGKSCVLVIAGPDEHGTLADLKAQVASLNLESDVLFPGSIPASERAEAVASAHCLVLPSRHENFGLTVVEALACGVPVVASKGTPWAELQGGCELLRPLSGRNDEGKTGDCRDAQDVPVARCGWWVEANSDAIAQALEEALDLCEDERRKMGANGRKLVEEKYQWSKVARVMIIATTQWSQ